MNHPLDQITADEINTAVELCRSSESVMDDALFVNISLVEPDKEFVRNFKEGDDCPRNLKIRGIDSQPDGGFVAILDVVAKKIAKVDRVPNEAQVSYSMAEVFAAQELTKADERYQEALKKRDITDLDLVQIDPWPAGGIVHESIEPGHRALKTISFLREDETDNAYAKPITGVISHIDLTLQKVTHVEDHGVFRCLKRTPGTMQTLNQSSEINLRRLISLNQMDRVLKLMEISSVGKDGRSESL